MKERTLVACAVALLAGVGVLASGNTDVIYVALSIAFFVVCIVYAEGCGKL
jgi:hypothetical protein